MVSHSMEDLAALSDRILVLSEGRLFRLGTPAEVFADVAALKAVGLGAPAPEAFAASLREVGFTLGRDLYDERTLAADIAAQLAGTPVAAAPDAAGRLRGVAGCRRRRRGWWRRCLIAPSSASTGPRTRWFTPWIPG